MGRGNTMAGCERKPLFLLFDNYPKSKCMRLLLSSMPLPSNLNPNSLPMSPSSRSSLTPSSVKCRPATQYPSSGVMHWKCYTSCYKITLSVQDNTKDLTETVAKIQELKPKPFTNLKRVYVHSSQHQVQRVRQ